MKIVICGISGFVGSALERFFTERGDEVCGVSVRHHTAVESIIPLLEGAEAVINLAGASIIGRCSRQYKEVLRQSRLDTTEKITEAIACCATPPRVLLNASAIGMSGLLVKSTQVMKENLEALAAAGIEIPILLGGAALTRSFIDDFCRPIYKGPIFYCKDAFDGVTAMGRIEAGNLDTDLHGNVRDEWEEALKEEVVIPPYKELKMPDRNVRIPTPPFWGRRVMAMNDQMIRLAFEWVNHKILFKQRWGYNSKGLSKEAYEKQLHDVVWLAYERLKAQFIDEKLFDPTILYGYWPCRSDDNTLLVFDEGEGWANEGDRDREPLESVIGRAIHQFTFPRQRKAPHRQVTLSHRS